MLSFSQRQIIKSNYYGLQNGQVLGCNLPRREIYFFKIFPDGSSAVCIRKKDKHYIFGDILYCKRMFKSGVSFSNKAEKQFVLSKPFVRVLEA